MADINHPTIKDFVNKEVRIWCDRATGRHMGEESVSANWQLTITQMPEWTSAAPSDVIIDGSGTGTDGRIQLTKNDVTLIMTHLEASEAQLDVAGVFDIINKAASNPNTFV